MQSCPPITGRVDQAEFAPLTPVRQAAELTNDYALGRLGSTAIPVNRVPLIRSVYRTPPPSSCGARLTVDRGDDFIELVSSLSRSICARSHAHF